MAEALAAANIFEVRPVEVSSGELRPRQLRSGQVAAHDAAVRHLGLIEVGVGQVAVADLRMFPLRHAEVGAVDPAGKHTHVDEPTTRGLESGRSARSKLDPCHRALLEHHPGQIGFGHDTVDEAGKS
jgi:hypothetical protein